MFVMKNIKPYKTIFIATIIFIFISTCVFVFFDKMANLYTAIATFIVGLFAIGLYIKQQEDQKRDAANIILMEIRYAEKMIEKFTASAVIMDLQNKIIPINNWYKYNYLFTQELDTDEINQLNNFYNQCLLIDKSIEQLSIGKQLEEKANIIQKALVDLAKESDGDKNLYEVNKTKLLNIVNNEAYTFSPSAPQNTISAAVGNIGTITTSTTGAKLKKIAKLK
jgi:c-di-AMP phosphodiesterase-like protein